MNAGTLTCAAVAAVALFVPTATYAQCGGGCCKPTRLSERQRLDPRQVQPPQRDQRPRQARPQTEGGAEAQATTSDVFYRAEGCGMSYGAAKAKALNYKCSMDGSRLVPTLETSWGTISFSTSPWPTKSGRTTVEVRPLDSNAQPIRNAEVSLTLSMPGMKMRSDDKVVALQPTRDGLYTIAATLPMGGKWLATVTVKSGDEVDTFDFDIEAAEGGKLQSSPPSTGDGRSNRPIQGGAARQSPPTRTAAVSYTCPMHPEVNQASSGTCPKCGMNLVKKQ